MSDETTSPNDRGTDQDAEPTLNAPGDAGPTGIEADGEGDAGGGTDAPSDTDDQDAEPTRNAPSE